MSFVGSTSEFRDEMETEKTKETEQAQTAQVPERNVESEKVEQVDPQVVQAERPKDLGGVDGAGVLVKAAKWWTPYPPSIPKDILDNSHIYNMT